MQVTVRYFAAAAEASGVEEETLEFGAGATLGELKALRFVKPTSPERLRGQVARHLRTPDGS